MKLLQIFIHSTLVSAFTIAVANSANALPGENINSMIQWSEKHSFLTKLTSVKQLEDGYPNYSSNRNFEGGSFSFNVYTDNKNTVTTETIDYRTYQGGDRNLKFAQNNGSGLRLVEQVYGSSIAKDFKNSKYVTQLPLDGYLQFYQGQRFAYQVWAANSAHQFTVIPLSKLEYTINNWKNQRSQ